MREQTEDTATDLVMDQEGSKASTTDDGQATTGVPAYEVRVSLTVAIPHYGARHPGPFDAIDTLTNALQSAVKRGDLPAGSHYHGDIRSTVRSAKEIASDTRRAMKRRRSA